MKFYLRHFFNLTFYNYGVLIKIGDCFQTLLVFMKAFFLYVEERSPPDPSLSSLHHLWLSSSTCYNEAVHFGDLLS